MLGGDSGAVEARPDVELVDQAKRGDTEAFAALVRRHQALVLRLAGRFLPQREDAEDVAQEAIAAAYRQLPRFRGEASFGTWLGRIALYKALRLAPRRERTRGGDCEEQAEPATLPCSPETLMVREAVARLPEALKVPLVLRFYEGLNGREIAALLGCRQSTIWTRIYRGLERLRRQLEDGEVR
jgi:RNA polymerase sigma-70 factor (ECF subfamily)